MSETITRRFYKTASAFRRPSILKLYSEAVQEAQKEISAGKEEQYYIVQIVAVVKKKPVEVPVVPTIVVDVTG